MVTPREVTWGERRELKQILETNGVTVKALMEAGEFPIEFAEKVLFYAYEDFRTDGKLNESALNELSDMRIAELASGAYMRIFHKAEIEKKS